MNGIEYQEFMYQGGNPKIMRLNLIKIFPERDCLVMYLIFFNTS